MIGMSAPRDFPKTKPERKPEEQPCQPKENPVLPDSFIQIYILYSIGFCIVPPKMNRRFHTGLPKILRRFHIGPPKIHTLKFIAVLPTGVQGKYL